MAEAALPTAGNTVSNRRRDSSRYTDTSSGRAKGHTPPTAWPMCSTASSGVSILALTPKKCLYLLLSMRASPAATTRMGLSPTLKLRVLAMRAGATPRAAAASSTVALETSSSRMRWATP